MWHKALVKLKLFKWIPFIDNYKYINTNKLTYKLFSAC